MPGFTELACCSVGKCSKAQVLPTWVFRLKKLVPVRQVGELKNITLTRGFLGRPCLTSDHIWRSQLVDWNPPADPAWALQVSGRMASLQPALFPGLWGCSLTPRRCPPYPWGSCHQGHEGLCLQKGDRPSSLWSGAARQAQGSSFTGIWCPVVYARVLAFPRRHHIFLHKYWL